jgi:plasmid maintenance system antidote protein VapI
VDNLSILHELIYEIFTDPCWRGSHLPNDNIEIQVRSILERLGIEERRYREIIRQQEDLIKKLAYKLDNYTKFGY